MTRKFKKSIDFYFNITLIICYILFGLLLLSSCSILDAKEDENRRVNSDSCDTKATVEDLTGLDGCGKVLVLENGKKIIPFIFCGTPPLPQAEDFWINKAKDGMKVSVSYSVSQISNICMAGETVTLSCIQEISN